MGPQLKPCLGGFLRHNPGKGKSVTQGNRTNLSVACMVKGMYA